MLCRIVVYAGAVKDVKPVTFTPGESGLLRSFITAASWASRRCCSIRLLYKQTV